MASVKVLGINKLRADMEMLAPRISDNMYTVLQFYAPRLQAYASARAPWTDRTGNARQLLWADVVRRGNNKLSLRLGHGVYYGRYLEHGRNERGRRPILLPAMKYIYPQIQKSIARTIPGLS